MHSCWVWYAMIAAAVMYADAVAANEEKSKQAAQSNVLQTISNGGGGGGGGFGRPQLVQTPAIDYFADTVRPFDGYNVVKRAQHNKQYGFGLGKRLYRQYEFGLGKRSASKQYGFGLGKRPAAEQYQFGLGKRTVPTYYNFGLGRRASPQYSFGLGKRVRATIIRTFEFALVGNSTQYDLNANGRIDMYTFYRLFYFLVKMMI